MLRSDSIRKSDPMRLTVLLVGVVLVAAACGGRHHAAAPPTTTADAPKPAVVRVRPKPVTLVPSPAGVLPAPLQDAAAAPWRGGAVLLGGLTAADTSSDQIVVVRGGRAHVVGHLPGAFHDSAAVRLGKAVYAFGGGNGVAQLDSIVRVDPGTGHATTVARLPAPSSDQAAASIGATAYVVGGYTGTRWLDTIVAWRPGSAARVVAHLPRPVRYAAVAAADGKLVIAGGSLADGTASTAVYEFVPNRHVRLIGRLPAPTTHATAAAIGGVVYVVGGRSATLDTPTTRIVAVDPDAKTVRNAGALDAALSDTSAVARANDILLSGGHAAAGTVDALTALSPGTRHVAHVVNVYAADRAGNLSAAVRGAKPYVYVPNSDSNTVDVIDQRTFKIVRHFAVGGLPQHVVPAWNLRTLYVTNDLGNSLTAIDPRTGRPMRTIQVEDPYNMYFTPDGKYAIVVAERLHRLDFRNARTFALHRSVQVPCVGVDHMDFSADGRFAVASCEFSGQLIKVDIPHERVVATLSLGPGRAPQDVKLSPDGSVFYVADMNSNGVWLVDAATFRVIRFMHTGLGAHGLYVSRDARFLYVTNRGEGSISVVSFRSGKIVTTWHIPGGGSPDMGNVSADGRVLWLSGRYNGVVYAISTSTGHLLARIPVGAGPHGLCVWPQPGRYSLGHTGILR
jgi:DNA-binding beta-propeller fold protein YncE